MKLYTIGHSTRTIEGFISILRENSIDVLVDVRAFPVSRRNPQFSREELQESLTQNDVGYLWFGRELGGYRSKSDGLGEKSPNKGWQKEGFRIYADYMLTDRFKSAVNRILELAKKKIVVYMCAEKFYWRCHRRLISDYLLSQGHEIWHIFDLGMLRKHELSIFASVVNGVLTYHSVESSSDPSLF